LSFFALGKMIPSAIVHARQVKRRLCDRNVSGQ